MAPYLPDWVSLSFSKERWCSFFNVLKYILSVSLRNGLLWWSCVCFFYFCSWFFLNFSSSRFHIQGSVLFTASVPISVIHGSSWRGCVQVMFSLSAECSCWKFFALSYWVFLLVFIFFSGILFLVAPQLHVVHDINLDFIWVSESVFLFQSSYFFDDHISVIEDVFLNHCFDKLQTSLVYISPINYHCHLDDKMHLSFDILLHFFTVGTFVFIWVAYFLMSWIFEMTIFK